jgi:hypothetical protein
MDLKLKIGRNDPCLCGSGKKYKKCCLNNSVEAQDFGRARIKKSRNDLIDILMEFAAREYGEMAILEAWDEFHCWDDDQPEFEADSHQLQIFMPWFFYDWTPDPAETTVKTKKYHDVPIGKALLDKKNNKLSPLQKEIIEKCLDAPFSYFEIVECRKRKGYQLKDLFTLEEYSVIEKSASEFTEVGDLIFGKLTTIEGITTLEACAPFAIPPSMKLPIIEIRNQIKRNYPKIEIETLKDYYLEFLDLYHEYHDAILNPAPPVIRNTDGDDMVPQKLIFQINSTDEAFEKLHHLDFISTKDELLEDAEFNKDGGIKSIEFKWFMKGNKTNKSWDNTLLGNLEIADKKLTIFVNSNERAEKIKKIVKKELGKNATYKNSIIEDVTSAISRSTNSPRPSSMDQKDLMDIPELQEKMKEMLLGHWENWVDEEIPALGGITPIEASKTEEGRELLNGLLTGFEREAANGSGPMPELSLQVFQNLRGDLNVLKEHF